MEMSGHDDEHPARSMGRHEVNAGPPQEAAALVAGLQRSGNEANQTSGLGYLPFCEGSEGVAVVRMPPRQGGAVFDDIGSRPENAALIELSGSVVVWTQDIEIPGCQPLHHEIDGLFRCPGAGWFIGTALCGEPCADKTRGQQMSPDETVGGVPQFMLQRFREDLYAGLGDVIRGIAGRGGDPLFRARVDYQAVTPAIDH